jgi:hypothetical protein
MPDPGSCCQVGSHLNDHQQAAGQAGEQRLGGGGLTKAETAVLSVALPARTRAAWWRCPAAMLHLLLLPLLLGRLLLLLLLLVARACLDA